MGHHPPPPVQTVQVGETAAAAGNSSIPFSIWILIGIVIIAVIVYFVFFKKK